MSSLELKKRIIPAGWNLKKISEVATTGSGGTPLSTNPEYYVGGDIPWINSGEIGQSSIKSTKNFITKLGLENSSAKFFPKGSVLLAMYGATAGKASLLEIDATTNQAVCAITPNKGFDAKYIKYYLDVLYNYLVGVSSGSARDNLSQNGIAEIEIPFPPEIIQNKIASVLSSLDAKIELNNRINAELEQMAKTLYDYWFVQFDFPNKNGRPYKSSGGKMVWSEELKREVPEGWEVKPLGKVINIIRGASPRPIDEYLSSSGMPWVKISDATKSDSRFIIETNQCIIHEGVIKSRSVFPNTLILSNSATPAIPRIMKINACVHDGWLVIDNYSVGLTPEFMYHYFDYERPRILSMGSGSIFKNLKTDYLKEFKFILPPISVLKDITPQFQKINETIYLKTFENQKLTELRDWLLPMLMNGQVKVGNGVENVK